MSGPCLCGDPHCGSCFPGQGADLAWMEEADDKINKKFPEFEEIRESEGFQIFVSDVVKIGSEIDHIFAKAYKAIDWTGTKPLMHVPSGCVECPDHIPYVSGVECRFYELMKFIMKLAEVDHRKDRLVDEAQYKEYLNETKLNKSIEDWKNGGQGGESTPGEHEVDGPPKGGTGHGK